MSDSKKAGSSLFQTTSNLKCQDLYAYMKAHPDHEKFYNYPTICLAVYRYPSHLTLSLSDNPR